MDKKIEELAVIKKLLYDTAKKVEHDKGFDIVIQFEEQSKAIVAYYETALQKKWISVNDRLPENRKVVLIFWIHNSIERITSGSYHTGYSYNYWQHGNATQLKVTHWMELPPPPIQTKP